VFDHENLAPNMQNHIMKTFFWRPFQKKVFMICVRGIQRVFDHENLAPNMQNHIMKTFFWRPFQKKVFMIYVRGIIRT